MQKSKVAMHIILLRDPSGDDDPYEVAFRESGFTAESIPVLTFEAVNAEVLADKLGSPSRYSGLILTSPRAVAGLGDALRWLPAQVSEWEAKPVYAVGPRTAGALDKLGIRAQGQDAGNAEALLQHIVAERARLDENPLLFVCGERRRGVIGRGLAEAGIPCEELPVYETQARDDFDVLALGRADWLAFFSPSGVEVVQAAGGLPEAPRYAAIGSTTAGALRAAGIKVDAVAAGPTPEALVEATRPS